MQRDLTKFKILQKFSILQFMFMMGISALVVTLVIRQFI